MRILMTGDAVGGVWTYCLELANVLGGRGIDVWLAVMGRRLSPDQHQQLSRTPIAGLYETDLALEWMPDPWHDVEAASEWLMRIAEEVRPDVVHLNSYVHGSLPWTAPVVVVGHSCVLSWWRAVKGEDPPAPDWSIYRDRVAAGLAAADAVVAPTAAMLDSLRDIYGAEGRAVVIPNARRAEDLGGGDKRDVIVGIGRVWDEAKNLRALQRVSPRLHWPVVLAGEENAPTKGAASSLGRLTWPEVAELLSSAAIFCEPALYEPFGLAALEAGLAGCALVLGDIPSLREVWGDAAMFVDPRDDEELVRALQRLVVDERLRRDMQQRARARATTFTPDRMAESYLRLYRELSVGSRRTEDVSA